MFELTFERGSPGAEKRKRPPRGLFTPLMASVVGIPLDRSGGVGNPYYPNNNGLNGYERKPDELGNR